MTALLVTLSGGAPAEVPLGAVTSLGRAADNHLVLADPMVSLRHAEIARAPDGAYVLRDLGSRHGTFIAGARVQEAQLTPGDEIVIGIYRFRFATSADALEPGRPISIPPSALRSHTLSPERFPPADQFQTREELARDYEKLRAGFELSRAIGVEHDLLVLLERILLSAVSLLPAERGTAVLVDPETQTPLEEVARLRDGSAAKVIPSRSVVGAVLKGRAGVIAIDAATDVRFERSASIFAQGIRSAMCVPILYRDELLGYMYLDSVQATAAFTEKDLDLFATIASQAAFAIKSASLLRQIRSVTEEERRRLDTLVESLPDGVVLLDADREVIHFNLRAVGLLKLIGAVPERGRPLLRLGNYTVEQLLGYEGEEVVEFVLPGKEKRTLTALASRVPPGPNGRAETVLVIRDVTEERQREGRMAQEDRVTLMGRLAGGVAHDFNNILSVIINYAEVVQADTKDARTREDLEHVRVAALRASKLTGQLLSFSRGEVVKPRVIDLNATVREAQELLRRTLHASCTLVVELADDLRHARIDPSKLGQILLNLVVNARDAMPRGGTIRLRTRNLALAGKAAARESLVEGNYVELAVADTGTGMPPEVLERIFEPFYTTKEKGLGTGLGLSTVHGIVRQANGAIGIDSVVGQGTTFRLMLPATDDPLYVPGAELVDAGGGAETVLLVEDDAPVLTMTALLLRRAGYAVLEANDGAEAQRVAARHEGKIHLLLTDLAMPRLGGRELARALVLTLPELRILYMTGHPEEAAAVSNQSVLLPKPFTSETLLRHVREALRARPGLRSSSGVAKPSP